MCLRWISNSILNKVRLTFSAKVEDVKFISRPVTVSPIGLKMWDSKIWSRWDHLDETHVSTYECVSNNYAIQDGWTMFLPMFESFHTNKKHRANMCLLFNEFGIHCFSSLNRWEYLKLRFWKQTSNRTTWLTMRRTKFRPSDDLVMFSPLRSMTFIISEVIRCWGNVILKGCIFKRCRRIAHCDWSCSSNSITDTTSACNRVSISVSRCNRGIYRFNGMGSSVSAVWCERRPTDLLTRVWIWKSSFRRSNKLFQAF